MLPKPVCAGADTPVDANAVELVLWPCRPQPPNTPQHAPRSCPWFPCSIVGRLSETAHSLCGRKGTPDLVILVPHCSWNSNAGLTAAATESSVIKRIKRHFGWDYASCQKCILKQRMKTAFMFNLQKFNLK